MVATIDRPQTPHDIDLDAAPEDNWTLAQLESYALHAIHVTRSIEGMLAGLQRKSVITAFRLGKALWHVRDRTKETGQYGTWLVENGISGSTAFIYIQLFEYAKHEDAVKGMTLTQARKHFGISGNKKPRTLIDEKKKADVGTSVIVTAKPSKKAQSKETCADADDPVARCRMALVVLDDAVDAVARLEAVPAELRDVIGEIVTKANRMLLAIDTPVPSVDQSSGMAAATALVLPDRVTEAVR